MRAIDADHLKRWILSRVFRTQLNVSDVIDQIDREDTIEPQRKTGRWIPCSERLPEYGVEVLTFNREDEYEINHVIDEEDGEWFFNGAIAWMPLPESYKEVEDDKS